MTFQIKAISPDRFIHYFEMSEQELQENGARRIIADEAPGFPCRVTLADAEVGEELILCNFQHLDENSPYAASHAIYVRKGALEAKPTAGEVPEVLSSRLLSVRGFNENHLMVEADVIDGTKLAEKLNVIFANDDIDYVHIHNAKQGCFAAKAMRS